MNMKILTVTLLLTLVIFLNSIGSSQQALLRRLRRMKVKVFPLPRITIKLRGYIDETNTEQPLPAGQRITLGIRKIEGIDFAVGIELNGIIRPMIDYEGHRFLVKMIGEDLEKLVPDEHMEIPYGLAPEDTIGARILNIDGE